MIVTLMFAQAGYLAILYFGALTRGDEGFTIARAARALGPLDLSADGPRYAVALALFAAGLLASLALVRARTGRVLVAMRENAERSRMLGYDPFRYRLLALARLRPLRRRRRRRLRPALRLCRRHLRLDPVLDPAAALGAARRRRHRARAASSAPR